MSAACPDARVLESFAAAGLEPAEHARVAEHVRLCRACQTELGGLAALRLGLSRNAAPAGEHLGDERLALLADDALPEPEREQALRHLLGCPECLGSLVALERALTAVGEGEHSPPPALLERGSRQGTRAAEPMTRPEEKPWLAWLLGGGLGWRLAAAGAAAAAILALVVLTSGPRTPGPTPGGPALTAPAVEVLGERPPAPAPEQVPARNGQAAPEQVAPGPPRAVLAWGVLAKDAAPPVWLPLAYATALTEEPGRTSFGASFQLGRAAAYLRLMERSSGLISSQGKQLGEVVGALEPALRAGLGGEPAGARLRTFAGDLAQRLGQPEPDPQALQVRLQVFLTALDEALAAPPQRAQAAELGRLVQELTSSSLAEAHQVPDLLAPGPEPLRRLRDLLGSAAGLGPDEHRAALAALDELTAARAEGAPPERDRRVRTALERLDGALRHAR